MAIRIGLTVDEAPSEGKITFLNVIDKPEDKPKQPRKKADKAE